MHNLKNGFFSGFVATFAVVSMMAMNNALKGIPEVHVARTLAGIVGQADHPSVGWIAVMVCGVFVFSTLFVLYERFLPLGTYLGKGIALAIASWLVMMVVFMPLADAGLFGLGRSAIVAPVTLMLNLVYWVLLAVLYRYLAGPQPLATGRGTPN